MKTDAEVLSGAIEILEQEGMWCKEAYYLTNGYGMEKVAFCAEGAIREAAGYWLYVKGALSPKDPTMITGIACYDMFVNQSIHDISEQCHRLDDLVVQNVDEDYPSLNWFNDNSRTTVSDVLLAMKKALNEVENAEGGDVHP